MFKIAFFFILLTICPNARAADLAGTWDMVADGSVISRLELRRTAAGWSGVWSRPTAFSFDGNTFSAIEGPVVRRVSASAKEVPTGLEFSFPDPRPDSTPDIIRIMPLDERRALLELVGPGFEPITLVKGGKSSLGPWVKERRYTRTVHRTNNPDIAKIFEEDQADRTNEKLTLADLAAGDKRRRETVRTFVESGKLSSAQDFYQAAVILQHGDTPRDYLWAHALATVAAARGNSFATWLAAASLDRYLQAIGQPQIFGTQYLTRPDAQAPKYDPSVIPDSLRKLMRVPDLEKQDPRIRQQSVTK